MTATREAIVLPALFLAVTLLGGFRLSTSVVLLAPPLVALVLGVLLVGVLARGGALVPDLFVNAARSPLENANGVVVLATLCSASAQVFNLLTPDTGLLHLLFAAFFFLQLLTTMAGASGPRQLLRSLGVVLGGAFVLRWVILENLYSPNTGTAKRLLTLLVEGASLGAIGYEPHASVTGYVAFFTIALFLIGLWLLSSAGQRSPGIAVVQRAGGQLMIVVLVATLAAACGRQDSHTPATVSEAKTSANAKGTAADMNRAVRLRDGALRAARVWHPPAIPVGRVNFAENPEGTGGFRVEDDVTCRFLPKNVGGTSPKFNCELTGGDVVRVKYGTTNPEIHAEVAASRLLTALGFGADRMYVVRRVHCLGCPAFPFQSLKCLDGTGLDTACFAGPIDYSHAVDFDPAVIERRHDGSKIEAIENQGWAWFELDRIDPAQGGSSRAEVDALRLMAMLLAHWDNKAENQRLVCPPGAERGDGSCKSPIAIVQDLGATFGPLKVDLSNWLRTPIWADTATCTVSMESLPYKGGTFPAQRISDAGRRMLLGLLEQLSDQQLTDLFNASRITSYDQVSAAARRAGPWVEAFKGKVRQIRDAGPCPQ